MPTNFTALNAADQTLHSLAQLLALTGMQWLPPQPDDSEANLRWNPDQHRLQGRVFTVAGQSMRLVLDLDMFALQFVDEREQVHAAFEADNRTPHTVRLWWQGQLNAWGITEPKPVNYHLTQELVPTQTPYQRPDGLPAWTHWRTVANVALDSLNKFSGRESEVRVWPHHFDTGVYYTLPDAVDQERAAIWAGYSIADALSDAPYFYLSGYIRNQPIDFAAAPPLSVGAWVISDDWKGALLPLSAIAQTTTIDQFLQEAYRWLHQVAG